MLPLRLTQTDRLKLTSTSYVIYTYKIVYFFLVFVCFVDFFKYFFILKVMSLILSWHRTYMYRGFAQIVINLQHSEMQSPCPMTRWQSKNDCCPRQQAISSWCSGGKSQTPASAITVIGQSILTCQSQSLMGENPIIMTGGCPIMIIYIACHEITPYLTAYSESGDLLIISASLLRHTSPNKSLP